MSRHTYFWESHCQRYVQFVVITIRPFPRSWLITGFIINVIRRVPDVDQELITLPEHLSSPQVLVRFVLLDHLFSVQCFVDRCLSFCPFSLGHCVVCHSPFCGFWLYRQTFLIQSQLSFPFTQIIREKLCIFNEKSKCRLAYQ